MLTDVLLAALAVTAGFHVVALVGMAWLLRRQAPPPPAAPDAALPTLAVVVAARDEAGCIGRCLEALLAQDYPPERLTLIVADDHSTDGTSEAVARVAAAHAARAPRLALAGEAEASDADAAAPAVRCLRVPDPEGHLRGKAQALHTAIEATQADLFLVTDADCAPPPTWARAVATRFATDPSLGIVCGMSRITPRPGRPGDRAQAVDWALMIAATAALAEAGLPATGMGNNMGVRRAAYAAVGGYPALPFSVTEDMTLVRAVAERTPFRVAIPLARDATVWTLPADDLGHAYAQRRRWARGGLGGGPAVWAAYVALFVGHALPLVMLPVAPLAALAALAAMTAADGALVGVALRRTGPALRLPDLLGGVAFRLAYLVTLPSVLLLRPQIGWKGRRH